MGHGEELGRHRPPEGHVEVMETLPSSREFWERFASKRNPVLFRGIGETFPAFRLWTDEYMIENFGDLKIKIEGKTEKDYYPEGELGVAQDTIRHFLETYQRDNKYVVSQLPDRLSPDVTVLPFLNCGTFKERLLEANLWMSSGGTKSLLHRDADNAINCLLNGTKDWVMIDPAHEDLIPIAKEDVDAYGGFSLLNPDSVDLERYPRFREVPWTYVNMTADDCLFLPYGYWHQVRSYGEKNLAVSVLFSRLREVDLTECETGPPPEPIRLSDSQMVFRYDGYGDQTMGNTDPFELQEQFTELCEEHGFLREDIMRQALSEEVKRLAWAGITSGNKACGAYRPLDSAYQLLFIRRKRDGSVKYLSPEGYNEFDDKTIQPVDLDLDIIEDTAKQMMTVLDPEGTGEVPCDKMIALKLDTLTLLADIMDNDPANTEDYEYAKFDPEEISELISTLVGEARYESMTINPDEFVQRYQSIGGSAKIAKEVLGILNPEEKREITVDDVFQNLPAVLDKFDRKMKSEITSALEWGNALREHATTWHTEGDINISKENGKPGLASKEGLNEPMDKQETLHVTIDSKSESRSTEHAHEEL